MSSRSSTRRTICPTWRSMMLPAFSMIGSLVRNSRRKTFRALRMGERGLRSSWDSMAMNSSLWRLASARPSARLRWASVASLSDRSWITTANDRACLFSLSSSVTVARHQNRVPSLRTCQQAPSARPPVQGCLEFMLGQAGEDVFGGIETGKMLPDDFMGVVAEDAFRPCVPANGRPSSPTRKTAYSMASVASRSKRSPISCEERPMESSEVMAAAFLCNDASCANGKGLRARDGLIG